MRLDIRKSIKIWLTAIDNEKYFKRKLRGYKLWYYIDLWIELIINYRKIPADWSLINLLENFISKIMNYLFYYCKVCF